MSGTEESSEKSGMMDVTKLHEALKKLEDLEALEASVLDAIPHAVLGFEERKIIFANNAAESVLGWKPEELVGQDTRVLYRNDKDYHEIGRIFYEESSDKIISIDRFPCRRKNGQEIICRVSGARSGETIEEKKVVTVYEDITEQVRLDEALREERDRAQKYLDIAGVIIMALDVTGKVKLINQRGCEILQYDQKEILGKNWFDHFVPKKTKGTVEKVFKKLVSGDSAGLEYFENPVVTMNRKERIISWYNISITDEKGNITGVLSSGEDITERKRAEAKLLDYHERLRFLSSELSMTEQRERQKIATELHDRIGQTMAVSKMKLEAMKKETAGRAIGKSLKEVIELVDQLIYDTRSLTFELSPPILYILGLDAALEWLAEQFQEKHGIRTRVNQDGKTKKPDDDIAFFIFRSTQELLINVAKHAKANSVMISIKTIKKALLINVADDGVGFSDSGIEYSLGLTGGFGIFSIRERLKYFGGEFHIESGSGRGSRVTMVIPLSIPKRKRRGR